MNDWVLNTLLVEYVIRANESKVISERNTPWNCLYTMEFFGKIVTSLKRVNYLHKMFHHG